MKLSPWKWHKRVPKTMLQNLQFRKAILQAAQHDKTLQKALLEVCKNDLVFFIDVFGCQFNPDKREKGPFICRPYQEMALLGGEMGIGVVARHQWGILECVDDGERLIVEKSRYVGLTWLVCFLCVWLAIFHENTKSLVMSKDEETAEDAENPASIFWKLNFITEWLPDWMIGSRKKKKGVIRLNDNTITSTANVESAGVGDRATVMPIDEFGQFKKGAEIYSMTSDTASCRIFIGTHKGRDTFFYALCNDPKYVELRRLLIHWSMDPEKRKGLYRYVPDENRIEVLDKSYEYPEKFHFVMEPRPAGGPFPFLRSPWYDKACKGRSDYDVAMNLDIDPTGSSITFFDDYRIGVLKDECRPPLWQGRVEYDKEAGTVKRLIKDPKGTLKLWVNLTGDFELPKMRAGAGVDVAAGTGWTPSCLSVLDAATGDKVLAIEDATTNAIDFASLVAAVLRMIKDDKGHHPMVGWEIQGGATFAKQLMEVCRYFAVYWRRDEDIMGRPRDAKGRAGWSSTALGNLKLLEEYRDALYTRRITNWDDHALDETLHFVYAGNTVTYRRAGNAHGYMKNTESGASVHHGDIVKADALAYKMICELGFDRPQIKTFEAAKLPELRTSAFREWLSNQEREEEEVWV